MDSMEVILRVVGKIATLLIACSIILWLLGVKAKPCPAYICTSQTIEDSPFDQSETESMGAARDVLQRYESSRE